VLTKALAAINNIDWEESSEAARNFEIILDTDESLTEGCTIPAGYTITLKGTKSGNMENNITIAKTNTGSLLSVSGSGELILEDITLRGNESNTAALVNVGGKLTMKSGSRITGNSNTNGITSNGGGGVKVVANGYFIMEDGSIDNNKSSKTNNIPVGGGVCNNGYFKMTGGTIANNTVGTDSNGGSYGGGVYSNSANSFEMTGGTIRENKAQGDSSYGYHAGGGVYIMNGNFTMSGTAEISNNETTTNSCGSGGGVYFLGTFTMNGGTIKGNRSASGGGVEIFSTNNNNPGSFTMTNGVIEGNRSTIEGAGAAVNKSGQYGSFIKTGGIIYGTTTSDGKANCKADDVDNTVHAIAVTNNDKVKLYYDNDADINTNLDSSSGEIWSK
jgi:hypothetical protein